MRILDIPKLSRNVKKDHPSSFWALRERNGVKAKAYMYCFYDVALLLKSGQGGEGVWKLPNLSVHALWMVPKGTWYHKTFEEWGEIRKIKITYELFNYLYKYRPSFHHWSHGKKGKVHVPQRNEMLSLHDIYCIRFYYQKWI